jgi:hypothetical protein
MRAHHDTNQRSIEIAEVCKKNPKVEFYSKLQLYDNIILTKGANKRQKIKYLNPDSYKKTLFMKFDNDRNFSLRNENNRLIIEAQGKLFFNQ